MFNATLLSQLHPKFQNCIFYIFLDIGILLFLDPELPKVTLPKISFNEAELSKDEQFLKMFWVFMN